VALISRGLQGHLTAEVTPAGAEDRFGDPTPGGPSWLVPGCLLGPTSTSAEEFRANTQMADWNLYAPAGASFPLNATVTVAGVTAKVYAPPEVWGSSGQIVRLRRVTG
jgi:hypothetical protein